MHKPDASAYDAPRPDCNMSHLQAHVTRHLYG